jgi:hypothetical protein
MTNRLKSRAARHRYRFAIDAASRRTVESDVRLRARLPAV